MKPRLLLVEDDRARASMIERALARDYDCRLAATADEALHALAEGGWTAAVVDFSLGESGTGFLVLQAVHLLSTRTARVLYSSHWSAGLVLEAQRTAHAQVTLDARREEFLLELVAAVKRLTEPAEADADSMAAGAPPDGDHWCASAPASRQMLAELRQAADEDGPVFAFGEQGAGKHLAARTLQRWRVECIPATRAPEAPVRLVEVPPLRSRREDIPELAARFLADLAQRTGQPRREVGADALAECTRRDWWGNVRELHSTLYRAVRRAGDRMRIGAGDLPVDIVPPSPALAIAKNEGMLRALLLQLRTAGSVRGAAQLAGVTRPNFKKVMDRLGVLRADTMNHFD